MNRTDSLQQVNIDFRVNGREPERWHADNGTMEPAAYFLKNDRAVVPLSLAERESVFIVFRRKTSALSRSMASSSFKILTALQGPWELRFPAQMGAPGTVHMQPKAWFDFIRILKK